ncbi:MAG: YlmC/YmxH family sporulation protein [Erysipelotrichaceae bacterium]|nr:YlmC/YmxH family sporulation protein [Erysipelotrichaceae bacterium]
MRLSELQNKDVINVGDGKKIGNIIDIVINYDGKMQSMIVEPSRGVSIFTSRDDIEIKWQQIEKIGEDVIFVKVTL